MIELLGAVRAFVEDEVVPALEGRRRFHARVAANVLAIVARELAAEEDALAAEWRGLAPLLGHAGAEPPPGREALRAAVRTWTQELCERIRRGDADTDPLATAVRAHVHATVRAKLEVANPDYLARSGTASRVGEGEG